MMHYSDYLLAFYYGYGQKDRERDGMEKLQIVGPMDRSEDPLEVLSTNMPLAAYRSVLFKMGRIAGCAIVTEGMRVKVFGSRYTLEPFATCWYGIRKTDAALLEPLLDKCLSTPTFERASVAAVRSRRIQLPRLKHKVVATYPQLRDYTPGAKEEVVLLTEAKGLKLGGCVI